MVFLKKNQIILVAHCIYMEIQLTGVLTLYPVALLNSLILRVLKNRFPGIFFHRQSYPL